jgi:hypothetical protein
MQWLEPKYLWILFLPLLVVIGWILADRTRTLKLNAFGDPGIMGVPSRLARRIVAFALLVLAFFAASLVLPVPVREQRLEGNRPALLEILLDARLIGASPPEGPSPLDAAEDQVRAVLQMAGPAHVSLFKTGDPPEPLVPATSDGQGLLIVMDRLRLEKRGGSQAQLSESIGAMMKPKPVDRKWLRKIIVVSPDAPADPAGPPAALSAGGLPLLWLRLVSEDRRPAAAGISNRAPWIWSDDSAGLLGFLTGKLSRGPEEGGRFAGPSYVQSLAGLCFFALLGEMLLASYARSRVGGADE